MFTEVWRVIPGLHLLSVLSRFQSPGLVGPGGHTTLRCWSPSALLPRIPLIIWQNAWELASARQSPRNITFYSSFIFAGEMDL